MPNTAETIEILARKLERVRILNDLKECKTLEEYQELVKKYGIVPAEIMTETFQSSNTEEMNNRLNHN